MNELQKALMITKKYGEKFGGWTEEQIRNRLISNKNFQFSNSNFQIEDRNYKKKIAIAKEFVEKYLSKIGDILMVGVTGSVAAENPKKEDDIDLMIITKKNFLWKTRLKIFLIFWQNKIPHRTEKDNICINLWLDETALTMPRSKQSLKNAMDLILMKPIFNKNETYEKFILANAWAKRYVATGYGKIISNDQCLMSNENKENNNWIKKVINKICFWGQYWYMKRKITTELVDLHRAFFHPKR